MFMHALSGHKDLTVVFRVVVDLMSLFLFMLSLQNRKAHKGRRRLDLDHL
jgi:hypothetical protein